MHIPTKFLLPSTMRLLESAGICVLEYKRKPIEMTEFQWALRNYRIDSGATRNRDLFPSG